MHIRAARRADLPILQAIERAAGRRFRDIGMPQIAEDQPLALDELARYQQAGRAWVAVDPADAPVGYLIADLSTATSTSSRSQSIRAAHAAALDGASWNTSPTTQRPPESQP
jgi:hypothetical protein